MADTQDIIDQPDVQQADNEPIYKTKDGQVVTHTQLVSSGYNEDRISAGLQKNVLIKIGDTKDPDQTFQTKDGQKVSTSQLIQSGYTQDRIDKGVHNGILSPLEKKNLIGTHSQDLSKDTQLPSTAQSSLGEGGKPSNSDNTYIIDGKPVTQDVFDNSIKNKVRSSYEYNGEDENRLKSMKDLANEKTWGYSRQDQTTESDDDKLNDIEKSVKANKLSQNVMGVTLGEDALQQSKKLKEEVKKNGNDPEGLANDFSDFPSAAFKHPETNPDKLLQLKKDNPIQYNQLLNETKNQYSIMGAAHNNANNVLPDVGNKNEIASQKAVLTGNAYVGTDKELHPEDFNSFTNVIAQKQNIINENLTGNEKDLANKRLEQTYSPAINTTNKGFMDEYNNSPIKQKVDPNQFAGLKTLQLFHPEEYKQALDELNQDIVPMYRIPSMGVTPDESISVNTTDKDLANKMGGKLSDLTINQQIGKETVLRKLNQIGIDNAKSDIVKEQYNIIQQNKLATTDDEKQYIADKYHDTQRQLAILNNKDAIDDARYPLTAKLKFDTQTSELTNDSPIGLGSYMYNRYSHGLSSSVDAMEDIVTNMFGSDEDKANLSLKRIGEQSRYNTQQYLPTSLQSSEPAYKLSAAKPLQDAVNKILKGRNLSDLKDDEKNKINQLVSNNQSQISTVSNPNFGKGKNFISKATLYQMGGFGSDIASFMTQMGVLKGIGMTAKAAEAVSLLTPAYSEAFNQKLEEGKSVEEANSYGLLHGGIMALMAEFGSKYENVKNILRGGKSELSKSIAGISEETWDQIYKKNKSFIERLGKSIKDVGISNAKMIGTFGVLAPTATALADNSFYNTNISSGDIGNQVINSVKDMVVGSLPLIIFGVGMGSITHTPTVLEKAIIWDLGDNPDIGKAKIDEEVKDGKMTQDNGEERKAAIDKISKLITKVPTEDNKGNKLSDTKRMDYLYNLLVKDKANELKTLLPEKQKEKLEEIKLNADGENNDILNTQNTKLSEPIDKPTTEEIPNEETPIVDKEGNITLTNEAPQEAKPNEVPNPQEEKGIINEPPDKTIKGTEEPKGEQGTLTKKEFKDKYGFTKTFPSITDQQVADKAMSDVQQRADKKGISVEQQAEIDVANMKNKGSYSENDLMIAAFHLRTLDELINKSNTSGEDAGHLLKQREEVLTTLRKMSNQTGRMLRLFGSVYKKSEAGRLEVVRSELKKNLGVSDIPKTMAELKLSKLSDSEKMKVEPYVKAIEKLNKTISDINAKSDKETSDINSKEVQDYIESEVQRRLKEQKDNTPTKRYKKSEQYKDLARRIRQENELDKFKKLSEQGGNAIHKNSIFGDIDFKELAAQAIEYIAKGIEKGEDLVELIRKSALRFKGKFDASEFGKAITEILTKDDLPNKEEVIDKIKEMAKNSNANSITSDMVKHGLIKDVVNDYIHSDIDPKDVIKLATKELKEHLPNVTESQVEDAILKRGDFKEQSKGGLTKEIDQKTAEVKKLAAQQNTIRELGRGVRKEVAGKEEIRIAKATQDFIDEVNNDDSLTPEAKKEHIKTAEVERDKQLQNTRQGVLVNLKDSIDSHLEELTSKQNDAVAEGDKEKADKIADVKDDLKRLSDHLLPNEENLKDQIDKADQDLQAIIKTHEKTDFVKELKELQKDYHEDWQKTSDELQHQALLSKAERSLKESERKKESGQYTEIPTTPYDAKRDVVLAKKDAESRKAWSQLNSLAIHAREQQTSKKGIVGKWLDARREWLIMSIGAIEKVGLSAVSKPIIDPFIRQTFGRISGAITGVKPTGDFWSKGGFNQIFATYKNLKNEASANKFMAEMNNKYIDTIILHDKTVKDFGADSKEADMTKKLVENAELNHQAALGFLFINANSAIDIAQVMTKGATNLDAAMGKYKQSSYKERSKMQELGFWIQAVNRTHSAMKSVSQRQALLDHYRENLQYFQKKEGNITPEARQQAWDMAVLSSEEGRFGESTQLSRFIAKMKTSEKAWQRNTAQWAFPVAKISINITKQGIDMAFPMVEALSKVMVGGAKNGIKLNESDGKSYKNFIRNYASGMKRGFDELPLQQKKYINTLVSRGLFGMAQYALISYGLSSGFVKYGGAYDPNDPYGKKRPKGADGQPLNYGEWEFGGERAPKLLNLLINHSPYSLPASMAAVTYNQYEEQKSKKPAFLRATTKVLNEVYERLPFVTIADAAKGLLGGDQYKLENIVANELPTMKTTAEYFDKDENGETRKVQLNDGTFWGTVKNIWQSKVPFWRNELPLNQKGNTGGGGSTKGNYGDKK